MERRDGAQADGETAWEGSNATVGAGMTGYGARALLFLFFFGKIVSGCYATRAPHRCVATPGRPIASRTQTRPLFGHLRRNATSARRDRFGAHTGTGSLRTRCVSPVHYIRGTTRALVLLLLSFIIATHVDTVG